MNKKVWLNKTSGALFLAVPWYDIPEGFNIILGEYEARIGTMVKVGWLLENGYGVWFGVNFSAVEEFEDLGDL